MIFRIIFLWLLVTSATDYLFATAWPTGYAAVPGYRAVAYGNGADEAQSSVFHGHAVDVTGNYYFHYRYLFGDSGQWNSYDPHWNPRDPNGQSFSGGDPVNYGDWNGMLASKYSTFENNGGLAGFALTGIGNVLNNYSGGNSYFGAAAAAEGTVFNELGAMIAPATYANGLSSFGNNINSVYQSDGIAAASSYATTSWNVGAVYSGAANINLATGEPVGDWYQRGADIAGGVAGTAAIAAGGLNFYNWATTPAAATPAADADTTTFPLQLNSPQGITLQSGQPSLDAIKAQQIPGIMQSMLNGEQINSIGGWSQGNVFTINEGNTRMTAALQIFNETGDSSHVFNLLDSGSFVNKPPPIVTYPMTK